MFFVLKGRENSHSFRVSLSACCIRDNWSTRWYFLHWRYFLHWPLLTRSTCVQKICGFLVENMDYCILVTVYCHSETCEFLCLVTTLYAFPKVKRPQKENLLIIIRHKRIHFFSENCHTLNIKKKTFWSTACPRPILIMKWNFL